MPSNNETVRQIVAEFWISTPRMIDYSGLGLTKVPGDLRKVRNLGRLYLEHNELTELPDWLCDLPQLELLQVEDNPLVSPPPEIAAEGTSSILEFIGARRQGSSRQWTSKMPVVGEGGVGKTSTIKALLGESFDRTEETTTGAACTSYGSTARNPARGIRCPKARAVTTSKSRRCGCESTGCTCTSS